MSMPEQKHQDNNTESKHIELSEQYYKSRKQLMLYSGLFFVYEFIGVKVPAKPLPNSDIEVLSPQAVPIVLLLLVAYFLYRTFIGWHLSSKVIRKMKISNWDFYPSIVIATISIILFVYQSITEIQIADYITGNKSNLYTVLLVLGNLSWSILLLGYYGSYRKAKHRNIKFLDISVPFIKQVSKTNFLSRIRAGLL